MTSYYLSKDSYVCKNSDHAVFLDLRRDRYVALPPSKAGYLPIIVPDLVREGFPCIEGGAGTDCADELALDLEAEGLIVRDLSSGRRHAKQVSEAAVGTFRSGSDVLPQLRAAYLYDFAVSWGRANTMLRCFSIRAVVRYVETRKWRKGAAVMNSDASAARRMAEIFFLVQPIFYSASNACLRNSLTLLEFLARYDIYPTWVFGVHLQPFAAHCWVQSGGTILNDTAEHVQEFTPLMAI